MNDKSLPIIAVSTTADSTHESEIPRATPTLPPMVVDVPAGVLEANDALPQRVKQVLARKARTFQNGSQQEPHQIEEPSESTVVFDGEDQWIIRSILSSASACLFVADDFSSARMVATLLSECGAQQRNVGGLHVQHEVSVFHIATTRMNAVDQMAFDQWHDPGMRTFSKNYANSRYPHMPIRTPGLASRIRDDFDAAISGAANTSLAIPRIVVLQVPSRELIEDTQGLFAVVDELVGDLVSTSVAFLSVGPLDLARIPMGLFDSVFCVRGYEAEDGRGFSLALHQSQYLAQREFPPQVFMRTDNGSWQSTAFISDDPDIRDMAARYEAGESLASIGESYGIAKGQVSKLLKPLRLRGLLKTAR